jgi:hypothetical protein
MENRKENGRESGRESGREKQTPSQSINTHRTHSLTSFPTHSATFAPPPAFFIPGISEVGQADYINVDPTQELSALPYIQPKTIFSLSAVSALACFACISLTHHITPPSPPLFC